MFLQSFTPRLGALGVLLHGFESHLEVLCVFLLSFTPRLGALGALLHGFELRLEVLCVFLEKVKTVYVKESVLFYSFLQPHSNRDQTLESHLTQTILIYPKKSTFIPILLCRVKPTV